MASRPPSGGASSSSKGLGSNLDAATQRRLAQLLIGQAQQLEERASTLGVTAFCGKPVQRERPNDRFLANTLRGVASTNKRVQERQMWSAWRKAKPRSRSGERSDEAARSRSRSRSRSRERRSSSRDRSRGRSRERSSSREQSSASRERSLSRSRSPPQPSPPDCRPDRGAQTNGGDRGSPPAGLSDAELMAWLGASRGVRGRGEVGPRSDHEHGPYLPPADGGGEDEGAAAAGAHGRLLGPARPGRVVGSGSGGARPKPGGSSGNSGSTSSGSSREQRKRSSRKRSRSRSRDRDRSSSKKANLHKSSSSKRRSSNKKSSKKKKKSKSSRRH